MVSAASSVLMVRPVEGVGKELSSVHQKLDCMCKTPSGHELEGQAMPSW